MKNKNNYKNCLLLCSADHKVGAGHLIRSQILAESLYKIGWKIILLGPNINQNNIIKKKLFFKKILLKKTQERNFVKEINNRIFKIIKKNNINLLVIDSYFIKNDFQNKINKLFILKISNSKKNNSNCDLVLDYSFQKKNNKVDNSKFLIGPKYCLIQNKFNKINKRNSKIVLITFGASNTLKQILETIKYIKLELPDYKIHVSTPSKIFFKILQKKILKKALVILNTNLSKIINTYKYEFIISSGGHTMYEIVANKYPSLFIGLFNNQLKNINYLKKNDGAIAFRYKKNTYKTRLVNYLNKYKENKNIFKISNDISKKINFNGKKKVADFILSKIKKYYHKNLPVLETKRLKLIPLNEKNFKKLYYLRKKISNKRIVFRDKNKTTLESHIKWFKNYSTQKRIDYLIFEKKFKKYIGGLHYKLSGKEVEMGKFISNKLFLGKGYGLEATERWIEFGLNDKRFSRIVAITSKKNIININLNKKLGFKLINKKNGSKSLWQKMIYKSK